MINGISGMSPWSSYGVYGAAYAGRASKAQGADKAQSVQRPSAVWAARKAAQPDAPVQPVSAVRPVNGEEMKPDRFSLNIREGVDPAEMAVRMRIRYIGDGNQAQQGADAANSLGQGDLKGAAAQGTDAANPLGADGLKGAAAQGTDAANIPGLEGLKGAAAQEEANPALEESKSAREVMEEGECQTCKERKYQDGSDDPGVSFKNPTSVAPELAASAVRGHENEHVVREQAKAQREGRKVVSQSVTYHTGICPECGKAYVSGGTTRTVTRPDNAQQELEQQARQQDPRKPFSAIA